MGFRRLKNKVKVGSVAPDFTLPSQAGEMVSLGEYFGRKPVVLFFYPRDDSPCWTRDVCALKDNFQEFGKLDAEVIGISSDSVESHMRFAVEHDLSFTLLSD